MSTPLLSVCMIVKDESELLPGCLESLADILSELIVVDTGSSDETVEIATKFGARIFNFAWIDDFAAARNHSLAQATLPWILWLDADERLEASSIAELKRLLVPARQPTGYKVSINNLQPDQISTTISTAYRLISNHPKTKFNGRIHEHPHDSIKANGGRLLDSGIVLSHLGYALPTEQMAHKRSRNRQLLNQLVAESPELAYAWYTYGQNLALGGDHHDALAAYEKAESMGPFEPFALASLLNMMAEAYFKTDAIEKAKRYTLRSLAITTSQVGAHYNQYRIYQAESDVAGQLDALCKIMQLPIKNAVFTSVLPQDVSMPREQVQFSLGELYLSAGQPRDAVLHLEACLLPTPDSQPILKLLAAAYGQLAEWGKLIAILDRLDKPLSAQYKEMRSMGLIKLEEWEAAIEFHEAWLREDPSNHNLRQRLAGIYGESGNQAMMQKLMGQIRQS